MALSSRLFHVVLPGTGDGVRDERKNSEMRAEYRSESIPARSSSSQPGARIAAGGFEARTQAVAGREAGYRTADPARSRRPGGAAGGRGPAGGRERGGGAAG
eukprot:3177470-Prymnesium_polylepis.1